MKIGPFGFCSKLIAIDYILQLLTLFTSPADQSVGPINFSTSYMGIKGWDYQKLFPSPPGNHLPTGMTETQ